MNVRVRVYARALRASIRTNVCVCVCMYLCVCVCVCVCDNVANRSALALLENGAQALVIDLRGNVGGYFPAGVDLAKELLPSDQKIVSVLSHTSRHR